ncbi:hypothetical protein [Mesorhizobium sp. M0977]|uniref:hypothetical protein n=1 Tax=Mesorhizobium sp. M0977 TaxID=2957039 RepID=UPI00333DB560
MISENRRSLGAGAHSAQYSPESGGALFRNCSTLFGDDDVTGGNGRIHKRPAFPLTKKSAVGRAPCQPARFQISQFSPAICEAAQRPARLIMENDQQNGQFRLRMAGVLILQLRASAWSSMRKGGDTRPTGQSCGHWRVR